jgi:peptide/nickel transport system substrate-binding protein
MDERDIRFLVAEVRRGRLSRREFLRTLTVAGVTIPLAARILGPGRVHAQPRATFTPTKRGGGGPLRVLWWQAPTLLNPHLANGTKDQDACRVFYEPPRRHRSRRQHRADPRGRGTDRRERRARA